MNVATRKRLIRWCELRIHQLKRRARTERALLRERPFIPSILRDYH